MPDKNHPSLVEFYEIWRSQTSKAKIGAQNQTKTGTKRKANDLSSEESSDDEDKTVRLYI